MPYVLTKLLPYVVIFTAFILNYDFLDKKLIFWWPLKSQWPKKQDPEPDP